jgi:hypothetical protein
VAGAQLLRLASGNGVGIVGITAALVAPLGALLRAPLGEEVAQQLAEPRQHLADQSVR